MPISIVEFFIFDFPNPLKPDRYPAALSNGQENQKKENHERVNILNKQGLSINFK